MFKILNILLFISLILMKQCYGVIYRLNDSMYHLMPPVFHLDNFDRCVNEPDGLFCLAEFDLVSDNSSDLLNMIQEYSADTVKHFNHVHLHYGICVSENCKNYIRGNTTDQRFILEGCLNESMWDGYKLKTKVVANKIDCFTQNREVNIDAGDIIVSIILIILLAMNIFGLMYDVFCYKEGKKGNKLLLSFSLKKNWTKLVSIDENNTDERVRRLKGLHGLRIISIATVLVAHATLPFVLTMENTHDLEKTYYYTIYHIFFNGHVVIQLFFTMSGFLLAYGLEIYSEKTKLNWKMIPKGLFLRWLRLTPSFVVILAFRATLFRFIGTGPTWQTSIGREVDDCRRYYWENLLFINNYYNDNNCMIETWYLAADFQLYLIGLVTLVLVKGPRARKVVLLLLIIIGVVTPAAHTYFQDLNGALLVSPEVSRNYFISDPTFSILCMQGHNNLAAYVVGMSLGLLIHKLQTQKYDFKRFQKYGFIFPLAIPVCVALTVSTKVFYGDRPMLSIYIRAAFAAFLKPLLCVFYAALITGMVFKLDNTYRRIFEWRGWVIVSRLSYGAALCNLALVRYSTGTRTALMRFSLYHMIETSLGTTIMTFIIAIPIYVLIEAPIAKAMKHYVTGDKGNEEKIKNDCKSEAANGI